MSKRGVTVNLMRNVLKKTLSRSQIPSKTAIKRFLRIQKSKRAGKALKKPPYNKTPASIIKIILKSCVDTQGLESTPRLAERILRKRTKKELFEETATPTVIGIDVSEKLLI